MNKSMEILDKLRKACTILEESALLGKEILTKGEEEIKKIIPEGMELITTIKARTKKIKEDLDSLKIRGTKSKKN